MGPPVGSHGQYPNVFSVNLQISKYPKVYAKFWKQKELPYSGRDPMTIAEECLVSWSKVCKPRDEGRIGCIPLDTTYQAMPSKWIWVLDSGSQN